MAEIFHKTFATDLSEVDGTTASNGTTEQAAGAGLNGTSGGVLYTRTANTPNLNVYADIDFTGKSIRRMAWYTDLSSLSIGTNGHTTALMREYALTAAGTEASVVVQKASGALEYRLYLYNDSGVFSSATVAFGLPDWMELRVVRASGLAVSDGGAQLYAGGGVYAALGELVVEVTGVRNYARFAQSTRFIAGMHNIFANSASVGGSLKFDEWTLRDDDTPILFGVSESVISRGMKYVLNRRRRKSYCW